MKITIPKSYDSISIRQFTELSKLRSLDNDPIDYMVELITIVTGQDYKTISSLDMESIKRIYKELDWIENGIPQNKIIQDFIIDQTAFKAQVDLRKITANQYISIKEAVKAGADHNIHHIMAALYIPLGKKYNELPADEVADKFYNRMPISTAWPLAVFFCDILKNSMPVIQDYLSREIQEKMMSALSEAAELARSKTSIITGDGLQASTILQEETL